MQGRVITAGNRAGRSDPHIHQVQGSVLCRLRGKIPLQHPPRSKRSPHLLVSAARITHGYARGPWPGSRCEDPHVVIAPARYLNGDRPKLLLNYYRRRVGGSSVLRLLRRDSISAVSLLSPGLRASLGALSECFAGLADAGLTRRSIACDEQWRSCRARLSASTAR